MPVHDLGYRSWLGRRMPRMLRPWVVAGSGIALVWRRRWLRMMISFAWLPVVFPAFAIFAFEYSTVHPEYREAIGQILRNPIFPNYELAARALKSPSEARHDVWASGTA